MTAYVFFGKNGPTKTNNVKARHSRSVATYCETSIRDFIEKARKIQKKGRKVACIGIVQSFEATEFDYKSKDDAQAVNDLGWELAHKLYPNSECLVVTHNDGDGHKLHNHIQVLNEDMTTGKAIKENRQLYKMRTVNDELMREHGLSVIVPEKGLIKTPRNEFQKTLQQKLKKILTSADAPTDLGAYADACKKQGIDIKLDEKKAKKGKEAVDVVGLTYRMRFAEKKPDYYNPDRTVVRIRRSKASRLGSMFTFEGLLQQFELIKQRKKEQEKAKQRKAKPIAPPVKPNVKPDPQNQKERKLSLLSLTWVIVIHTSHVPKKGLLSRKKILSLKLYLLRVKPLKSLKNWLKKSLNLRQFQHLGRQKQALKMTNMTFNVTIIACNLHERMV